MIRAIRRWILEYRIDTLEADRALVAEGIAQARAKIEAGEKWDREAVTILRDSRAKLALLTPASEILADVNERKSSRWAS